MKLPSALLVEANCVARWLAVSAPLTETAALIILAGNAILPVIEAAYQLARSRAWPILITGGIGHATPYLRQAVAAHPRYRTLLTTDRCEADIIAAIGDMLVGPGLVPAQLLERRARHTGENATLSKLMLEQQGIKAATLVLMQDPLLMRRTLETFRLQWGNAAQSVNFVAWSPFIPQLVMQQHKLCITGLPSSGIWSVTRFFSLLCGEVRRLRDDKQGYGPQGAGFIGAVSFPAEIATASARLLDFPLCTVLQR